MNLLSLLILSSFSFSAGSSYQSKERSFILNPILRLSSPRRKRSLLLPNYGSIKLTFGLAKGLIGNTPKGLSLSYELCSYFVGPTVIKDLFNELSQMKPKQQVIEKSIKRTTSRIWHKSIQQKYQNISNGYYFSKPNGNLFNYQSPFKAHHFYPLRAIAKSKYRHVVSERSSGSGFEPEMINFPKKSPLRKALDYLLGPNARCSILKPIICKSKEILLPPGYSMIQDIVRIFISSLTKGLSSNGEDANCCQSKLFPDCVI